MSKDIELNIKNPELKKILKSIWGAIVAIRVALAIVSIAVLFGLGLNFVTTSKTASNIFQKNADIIVALVEEPEKSLGTTVNTVTEMQPIEHSVTAPVLISHSYYEELYDYSEYGESVEYLRKDKQEISFNFRVGDTKFYYSTTLTPPQFRAFISVFDDVVVREDAGYKIFAIVRGDKVVRVTGIEDARGQLVWTPNMEKGPRELNELEKWSVQWAKDMGYDFLIEDWFDECPIPDYEDAGCFPEYMRWSPAEQNARAKAFYQYASDPANKVWIEIWGAVDVHYRWVDYKTGEILTYTDTTDEDHVNLVKYPKSGWVALEIGSGGDYDKPAIWEPRYIVKLDPGFVIGIDQVGYIFTTKPLGYMSEETLAAQTASWSMEKIRALLKQVTDK